jgi:hypothetical protein
MSDIFHISHGTTGKVELLYILVLPFSEVTNQLAKSGRLHHRRGKYMIYIYYGV